jgi:hypothetical protein
VQGIGLFRDLAVGQQILYDANHDQLVESRRAYVASMPALQDTATAR